MIRIAISQAAFEALPATPVPVVAHEQAINNLGPRYVWISETMYYERWERILLKFIVGQRVVKQGEDSALEGEVVSCFVKRNLKTIRYVVESDDGVLHIASEKQL